MGFRLKPSLRIGDLERVVAQAERNRERLMPLGGWAGKRIVEMIAVADLVHGVWEDYNYEHDVGHMVIKGMDLAREVQASGVSRVVRVESFNFRSEDEARAFRNAFGDGAKDAA